MNIDFSNYTTEQRAFLLQIMGKVLDHLQTQDGGDVLLKSIPATLSQGLTKEQVIAGETQFKNHITQLVSYYAAQQGLVIIPGSQEDTHMRAFANVFAEDILILNRTLQHYIQSMSKTRLPASEVRDVFVAEMTEARDQNLFAEYGIKPEDAHMGTTAMELMCHSIERNGIDKPMLNHIHAALYEEYVPVISVAPPAPPSSPVEPEDNSSDGSEPSRKSARRF